MFTDLLGGDGLDQDCLATCKTKDACILHGCAGRNALRSLFALPVVGKLNVDTNKFTPTMVITSLGDQTVTMSLEDKIELDSDLLLYGNFFVTVDASTGVGRRVDPVKVKFDCA